MPEGDTIYRAASRLRQVLCRGIVLDARANDRFLAPQALVGAKFAMVEARGKHLLMHLQDGRAVHSHMGMTGSWHIYARGQPWQKPAVRAALAMDVERQTVDAEREAGIDPRTVVCFSPQTLELLTATELRRHRYLQQLGPDLLSGELDEESALSRFRKHHLTAIGEAVMNQTIVCGMGNVYKSETLFLARIDPFAKVASLSDASILQIMQQAQRLMRRNLAGYPRRTRFGGDGGRLFVYGRSGKPCFVCGANIRMRRQGNLGRSTYWCPECQRGE